MTRAPKVLLIGWDAADWKVIEPLIEAGRMPNIARLIRNGASGQIATLHPPLSPMLWTSIATGKRPFKHGIYGFSEPTPDGRDVQPVSSLSRKTKALWNILNQNGLRSVVVGWWPSHPAEPLNGVMVSDHYHRAVGALEEGWPLPDGAVHPAELADALAEARVHPDRLPPELVEPFIPLAREIDQEHDHRLAACMRTIAECMSVHSAAIWLMERQPWDFFTVYYDAIDHFSHAFMRYHPPRQSWIAERDFELYRNVVTMAYEAHDRMLGELLQRAGPETTAVLLSDHGFHPDHLRPSSIPDIPAGPAIEHRDLGILVVSGPKIKAGVRLHGSSLLDIAPTILALYGRPVGEDMDGKVLSQAFVETLQTATISSWDEVPGNAGTHPARTRLHPVVSRHMLEQMIALGYMERIDEDRSRAAEQTVRELRYNLGEAYQDAGRHSEAHEIFSQLHDVDPDEQRFAVRLFIACQALGKHEEMRQIVADLDGRRRKLFEEARTKIEGSQGREVGHWRHLARYQPAVVEYLKAQLYRVDKRYEEALAALTRITDAHLVRPGVLLETAELNIALQRWPEAEQIYANAVSIDPDNAQAHLGLCRMALRRRRFSQAAHAALDALQRGYENPMAHFLLGRALTGKREYRRAAEAFRAALALNPNFPEAHVRLAALLEKYLGDAEAAREHRCLAGRMRRGASDRPPAVHQCLVIVTGLPRSGTSMLMQMLAAGGMSVLTDDRRQPDEDNPRGYLEFQPVTSLLRESSFLWEARGQAIKIVAPLLDAVPAGLPCRVILIERDPDEVLESEDRMLVRRGQTPATAEHRRILKQEFVRTLVHIKAMLAQRPLTQLLTIEHREAMEHPLRISKRVNQFLGGALDAAKMAAVIDPALYRNRAGSLLQPESH